MFPKIKSEFNNGKILKPLLITKKLISAINSQ